MEQEEKEMYVDCLSRVSYQFDHMLAQAQADAIVVLLGLHYSAAGNATQCDHDQPWITDDACEGEGQDRQSIELTGNSTKLVAP